MPRRDSFVAATSRGYVGRYTITEPYRDDMPGSHACVFNDDADRFWLRLNFPDAVEIPWDTSQPDPKDIT